MKVAAEELDTRFVAETVQTEEVVFEADVLDGVDKYTEMALIERGTTVA